MAPPLPLVTVADLKPESDLLHLLFHRNKNQHRSGKWWKWFGMLRRNLKKLLDPAGATGVEARLVYMRKVLVPSCYSAFTSIIPNPSWAPLGLVLLGCLARIHKIIGGEEKREEVEEAAKVMAVQTYHVVTKKGVRMELDAEDLGEAIIREGVIEEKKGAIVELDVDDLGEAIQRSGAIELDSGRFGEAIPRKEEAEGEQEEDSFAQELGTSEMLLATGEPVAKLGGEPSKEGSTKIDGKKRDGKTAKKKAMKKAPLPPSPLKPRLCSPPPPTKDGPSRVKAKRRSQDKEGGKKKKKRRKGDEIDDLFAELL